ncbi:MAG: DNA polymerase III subunit delta [Alphaproteobacteria bacterium]|nr:DNA polymerase III subunit delta [Alphaproteobacteria bacterium]
MTALKAHEVERYALSPDLKGGLFLVYGSDSGLVHEIAERLIAHYAGSPPDAMAHISLNAADLAAEPGRIADEARTPSLFGGKRTVRVRNAAKSLVPVLAPLLDDMPDAVLILEAANLTRDDALRKLAEAHRNARALPCYADNERAIAGLIDTTFRAAGIVVSADAAMLLRSLLGNDREITRRELEKLCLFAGPDGRIDAADVESLIGDNSARAVDSIVDAAGNGDAAALDGAMSAALATGVDSQRILAVALAHFMQVRRLRRLVDGGETPKRAVESARPRVHFSRAASLERQLRVWSDTALAEACARLYAAIHDTRRSAAVRTAATGRALLAVCIAGAQR